MSSEDFRRAIGRMLNAQAASPDVRHIRDCARCRQVFEIAYEEIALSRNVTVDLADPLKIWPNVFSVIDRIRPEFTLCSNWLRSK